jgi:hypothetical protein
MGMFCPVNSSIVTSNLWLILLSKIWFLFKLSDTYIKYLWYSKNSESALILSRALVVAELLAILRSRSFPTNLRHVQDYVFCLQCTNSQTYCWLTGTNAAWACNMCDSYGWYRVCVFYFCIFSNKLDLFAATCYNIIFFVTYKWPNKLEGCITLGWKGLPGVNPPSF